MNVMVMKENIKLPVLFLFNSCIITTPIYQTVANCSHINKPKDRTYEDMCYSIKKAQITRRKEYG